MPACVDEIIAIDDCSRDCTFQTAASTGAPRVQAQRTPSNQVVGGAMVTGYRQALTGNSQIIAKMDGDDQMDPDSLPQLPDGLIEQGFDYAKSKCFLGSASLNTMPKHRLLGNVVLTCMTKLASGYWNISGPQNGYTAIKRDVLRSLSLYRIHIALFLFSGLALFLRGLIFGAYVWIVAIVSGRLTPTGTIMLVILPLFLGFQLLLQAMELDIQETPR